MCLGAATAPVAAAAAAAVVVAAAGEQRQRQRGERVFLFCVAERGSLYKQ